MNIDYLLFINRKISMNIITNSIIKINEIKNSGINYFILYLLIISFFVILNIFFSYLYVSKFPNIVDENNNIILSNLGFNFGAILNNLQIGEGLKANYFNIDFYVSRMPLLPIIITFIYNFISTNFFIIVLTKNLFFFSIIFLLLASFKKENKILFILVSSFIFLHNPHNLITTLSINFEEGFLNYFIIILFLLFISDLEKKYIYISVIISLIFFLKSSMIFLCTGLSLFFFYEGYKNKKYFYYPVLLLILSSIAWGSYSYLKTGFFAYGTNLVSYNSFTLKHAYNEDFTKIYPEISPDTLSRKIEKELTKNFNNEWEINNFYFDSSLDYLKSNPKDVFEGVLKKFQVVFFYFKKDSQFPNSNGDVVNKLRISNFPNKLIFLIFIFLIIRNVLINPNKKNFFLILLTGLYFFPYMVGFIYTRHCTALYMVATFFVINELLKDKKIFN